MAQITLSSLFSFILLILIRGDPFYWGQDLSKVQMRRVDLYKQASGHIFTILSASRIDQQQIIFSPAFASIPQVAISTVLVNTGAGQDLLISVKVVSITSTSMNVQTSVDDAVQLFDLSINFFATILDGIECNYFQLLNPLILQNGSGYRTQPERKKFVTYPKPNIYKVVLFLSGMRTKYSRLSAYPYKLVSELQVSDVSYIDFQVLFSTDYDNIVDMLEGYYIAVDQTLVAMEAGRIVDSWPLGQQTFQLDQTPVVKTNNTLIPIFAGVNQFEIGKPNLLNPMFNIEYNSMIGEQYIFKVDPLSSILYNIKYSWLVIKIKVCQPGEFLIGGYDCELSCPSGTYPDLVKKTCELCHISCFTCQGALSSQCLSCDEVTRTYSTGQCLCKDGYFLLNVLSPCQQCDRKCSTCDSLSTKCNICKPNRVNPPTCSCPPKFWDQGSYSLCQPCHRTCQECNGGLETQCRSCLPTFEQRSDNTCQCPIGLYEDIINIQCLQCHQSCLSCDAPSNNNCLSCDPTKFRILSGSVCTCFDGYIENQYGQCVLNTSTICVENCKKCDSQNIVCLECNTNRLLSYNQCLCQPGMFQNAYETCVSCYSNCEICKGFGRFECTQCMNNYKLSNGECIELDSSNNASIKGGLFAVLIMFCIGFTGGMYYLYSGYTTMQTREIEVLRVEFVKSRMQGQATQRILDLKQKWKEKKEEIDLEEDIVLKDVRVEEITPDPIFNITSITNQPSLNTLQPFNFNTTQQNYTIQHDQNNTTIPTQVYTHTLKTQANRDYSKPANPLRVLIGVNKQNQSLNQSLDASQFNSINDLQTENANFNTNNNTNKNKNN